ncbi:MAG: hypothetical protein ACTSPQ_05375 [Candidatus Helarchaeota archaeon]
MLNEKNNEWEEICRIEKLFRKQKGNDIVITIKSIEESDEFKQIVFSLEKENNQISIELTPKEWLELKSFFDSVDLMISNKDRSYQRIKLDEREIKEIQQEEAKNELVISLKKEAEKEKIETSESKEALIDEMVNRLEENRKELAQKETVENKIEGPEAAAIEAIEEIESAISETVVLDKKGSDEIKIKDLDNLQEFEDMKKVDKKEEQVSIDSSSIPKPIKIEDLPPTKPIKEIPLPSNLEMEITKLSEDKKLQEIKPMKPEVKKDEKEVDLKEIQELDEKGPEKAELKIDKTGKEPTEADKAAIESSGIKIQNLDELINEIAIIKEIDKEMNEIETKKSQIKEELDQIDDKKQLQTKLKQILNEPEEVAPISLEEMIYDEDINKCSPRLPRKPAPVMKEEIKKADKETEKEILIEKRKLSNEEKILKAMEETASLLPEGAARDFILEMKEKRKKIINES